METRELTCIGCPMGCLITVTLDKGAVTEVKGNTCRRGDIYARREVTNPTRIVTSTAIIEGGMIPRVSVKTASDVPKSKIFDVMKAINRIRVQAPVKMCDVLLENAADTGVAIIATKNVPKA